jgi:hypothetical protein
LKPDILRKKRHNIRTSQKVKSQKVAVHRQNGVSYHCHQHHFRLKRMEKVYSADQWEDEKSQGLVFNFQVGQAIQRNIVGREGRRGRRGALLGWMQHAMRNPQGRLGKDSNVDQANSNSSTLMYPPFFHTCRKQFAHFSS